MDAWLGVKSGGLRRPVVGSWLGAPWRPFTALSTVLSFSVLNN